MAANIFSPPTDDLIDLINTFAKTSAILDGDNIPSSHDVQEASSLNLGAFLHQFWKHVEPQPAISTTDVVETLSHAMAEMSLDDSGQPSNHHIADPERDGLSDPSKAALEDITSEVQILREALRESLQAINAIMAMYIIHSFDEPLHEVLSPTQCAQLFEAIHLADIASELDKQIRVLRAIADDHRRLNDPHLQLIQDIKTSLVLTFSDVRSFAVQHAKPRIPGHHIMLASQPGRGDLLCLDETIERAYASLHDRGDVMQHLVWEQERTIIALKVFLEDKIERFQQRRHLNPDPERSQQPLDRPRYSKDWPAATIPAAQLATILLSSMLAHLVSSTNLSVDVPQEATSSTKPMTAVEQAPAILSSQHPEHIEEPISPIEGTATPATVIGPSDICEPAAFTTSPRSASPELFTSSSPAPHVKFHLPKLLDKRRDSAISLLSSTGHPEKVDFQDDETLPDSDASECGEGDVELEPEVTSRAEDGSNLVDVMASQELTQDDQQRKEDVVESFLERQAPAHEDKGKAPASIDIEVKNEAEVKDEVEAKNEVEVKDEVEAKNEVEVKNEVEAENEIEVKNEVVVDSHSTSNLDDDLVEDLYSANDTPTLSRLDPIPISEENDLEGAAGPSGYTLPEATPNPDITASYATPFLSTNWPQRAWLQAVLSILTPVVEAHPASPMTPSFDPEAAASPPANPSSSEWYSGYDAWWSFAMRGGSCRREVDEDDESTITSTSRHSWGAGSRSTEAGSIDT
ncbi:uncharacterized protein PAC_15427 [Phialocephala subalpina]|uniref:Uncharacterized protein n=1 Tax=Phialocephala subalpina TaxID=576137 RepID=A0A1L7XKQ9_9HELO|nr:uncharacterized protein PAC_15427 [Phialocephala subalpina]